MQIHHCLAYGSNLHPLRLRKRVSTANLIGIVEMQGYQLAFHKRSTDESGKCLIYKTPKLESSVYGVLYEFDFEQKKSLDDAEGLGNGYQEEVMRVEVDGTVYLPTIYIAQDSHINPTLTPFHWYKNFVLAGASYHGFPLDYIETIRTTPSKQDLKDARRIKNEKLLIEMENFVYTSNKN
ncbi:MAG: gamma-glutamylcyclotransferase [Methylotenera sp.]|nr:MAG: gamma-glutamylcyclotransferase [Methylotenera sp.]